MRRSTIFVIVFYLLICYLFISCEVPDSSNDYTSNDYYTVTYNKNGGSGSTPVEQTVKIGFSVTIHN